MRIVTKVEIITHEHQLMHHLVRVSHHFIKKYIKKILIYYFFLIKSIINKINTKKISL